MITALNVKNFKSIVDQKFLFKNLNVLTGLNGSGKSSILQTLTLLKQSLDIDNTGKVLFLSGSLVSLGRARDVLYEYAENNTIKFDIVLPEKDQNITLEYEVSDNSNDDIVHGKIIGCVEKLIEQINSLKYIQADRISPKNLYPQAGTVHREAGWLGIHGEFTIDYIQQNEDSLVADSRCMKSSYSSIPMEFQKIIAPTAKLTDQISAWLQEISPGAQVQTSKIDHIDATTLGFRYKTTAHIMGSERRPINVGYGLTYSLPIITSCLTAKPGDILLLENPEAHLHPRGQFKLGLLIALCAQDGVQIFVETHSDHLLNGIRLATKDCIIDSDNVEVFYFDRDYNTGITNIIYPKLQSNGRFLQWPEGFFDEWEKALDELLS
ncbi:MAG: AAA family ATPase [Acinetobacter sp.]|uniref:AAA family ATPase n=1 Tax=Acinetobacter sp. TaxID=472 RepID=UPI003CFEF1E4